MLTGFLVKKGILEYNLRYSTLFKSLDKSDGYSRSNHHAAEPSIALFLYTCIIYNVRGLVRVIHPPMRFRVKHVRLMRCAIISLCR